MNALKSFCNKLPPECQVIAMGISIGFVLGNLTTIAWVCRPVFKSLRETQTTLLNMQSNIQDVNTVRGTLNLQIAAQEGTIVEQNHRIATLTEQNNLFQTTLLNMQSNIQDVNTVRGTLALQITALEGTIVEQNHRITILVTQNDLFKTLRDQSTQETKDLYERIQGLTKELTTLEINHSRLIEACEDLDQKNKSLMQIVMNMSNQNPTTPRSLSFSLPRSAASAQ